MMKRLIRCPICKDYEEIEECQVMVDYFRAEISLLYMCFSCLTEFSLDYGINTPKGNGLSGGTKNGV